jgi:methyltransferase family protein
MAGVETRRRVAELARGALAGDAEIIEADARGASFVRARAILLFDVLHLMRPEDQEGLLAAMAERLEPGGVVLVREADASAGWRSTAVRVINRIKAIAVGSWRQEFHMRTETEWRACFARHGFTAEVHPMGSGTPFANVLFRLTAAEPRVAAPSGPLSPPA